MCQGTGHTVERGGGAISFRTYNIGIGRNSRLELVLRGMSQANVDGRVFQ